MAVGVFDIDDLAEDGAPLVAATHALATGLFQGFGHPEALQTSARGAIRIRYWRYDVPQLRQWAQARGSSCPRKSSAKSSHRPQDAPVQPLAT
jgi:hypothetical protein